MILTDGVNEDPGSISRSSLVAELEGLRDPDRPVPVIAIAVGPAADKEEVKEIAEATGGSGHQVSDPAQIHAVILKAIMEAGSTLTVATSRAVRLPRPAGLRPAGRSRR